MLAGMMFQKDPFFKGADNFDQLIKIAKIVGTEEVMEYVNKMDLKLHSYYDDKMQNFKKKPWERFINSSNEELIDERALDLLSKLLTVDHTERIAAKEALEHPWFDDCVLSEMESHSY